MGPIATFRLAAIAVACALVAPASAQDTPRWHLVGELKGLDERLPGLDLEVVFGAGEPSTFLLDFESNRAFDVDLGEQGVGRELPDVVRVRVAHPDYEDATFEFVQRVHRGDAVEFHGELSVVRRPTAHIRGRVVAAGAPSAALVRAFAFDDDGWPLPQPIGAARAGPDGEFFLRLVQPERCVVVASTGESRPGHVELELSARDLVSGVELALGGDSTLAGVVRHADTPAAEGTIVSARRVDWVVRSEPATPEPDARPSVPEAGALAWDAGRYENLTSRTTVAADGSFRFRGLAPGLYDLSILHAVTLDGFRYTWQASEETHHVVEVPDEQLVLLSPLRRLVVKVRAGDRPLDQARVSLLDRASSEVVILSSLVHSSTQRLSGKTLAAVTDASGELELLVDPDSALDLRVERGGFVERRIELAGETYGGTLVVDLTRAHPATDVRFELSATTALPRRVVVDFQGLDVRENFQRTLDVRDGVAVARDVPPGEYWMEVAPPSVDPDTSPRPNFHLAEAFKLEVSAGVTNTRAVELALGGLLRVTATGSSKELVRARMVVRDADDRVVSHTIGDHGPWIPGATHTSRTPLAPGRYRLKFMALDHADWYGFAEVVGGEVTSFEIALAPR